MHIFIIGGTGFIGKHLVEVLGKEHDLTVLHRGATKLATNRSVQLIQGDRRHLWRLQQPFRAKQPDVVIDLVPYYAQDAWDVVQFCQGLCSRVIAISSGDVYRAYEVFKDGEGPVEAGKLGERSALRRALYPYRGMDPENELTENYDKILVEQLLIAQPGIDYTILRLGALYGPYDQQRKLKAFIAPMLRGDAQLLVSPEKAKWKWTMAYVGDIVEGIRLAVEKESAARNQIFNLGSAIEWTQLDYLQALKEAVGWPGEIVLEGEPQPPANYGQHLLLDTGKIRAQLGYRERYTPEEALAKTVAYERQLMQNS